MLLCIYQQSIIYQLMYSNFGTTQLIPLNSANSHSKTPALKKYATLSPYIAEIQKRKKTKSVLRENRTRSRNKHESSSKSFRIKQKSASSLHDHAHIKPKKEEGIKYILELVNRATSQKKQQYNPSIKRKGSKEHRDRSNFQLKINNSSNSSNTRGILSKETMDIKNARNLNSNHHEIKYFNSKRDKNPKKQKKQFSFRKNMYDSRSNMDFNTREKQTIDFCKHGYTDLSRENKCNEDLKKATAELVPEKKKFRRNKYEALYSSVNSNQAKEEKEKGHHDPIKSESQLDLAKKDSNLSINKQMDILAEKQIRNFYRQMRGKQIQRSVEKSTEKYFKHDSSYRHLKSNNDIQIYISTIKNPSYNINRKSNASTLNTSDQNNQASMGVVGMKSRRQKDYLQYQFDFKDHDCQMFSGIIEDNASEEESMQFYEEQTSFDEQRKQVEKQYFDKKSPNIEWSDEDCQIDQL